MSKESTHLSLDSELKRKAKNQDINLSDLMNRTLEQMVDKSNNKEDRIKELQKEKKNLQSKLIEKESEVKKIKEEIKSVESSIERLKAEIEAEEETTNQEERFLRLVDRHTDEGNWTQPSDIPIFWVQELDVSDKEDLWRKAENQGLIPEKLKVSA